MLLFFISSPYVFFLKLTLLLSIIYGNMTWYMRNLNGGEILQHKDFHWQQTPCGQQHVVTPPHGQAKIFCGFLVALIQM